MHAIGHFLINLLRILPVIHTAISGVIFSAWSGALLLVWRHRPRYPRLSTVDFHADPAVELPTLTVIVPACNEATTVERAMRSLMAIDYPGLEIIAVNDRSTDETGDILDCLAACCPRLRVIHIDRLPAGWLGKNHALHVASQSARGKWLLFTDADVIYRKDALLATIAYAQMTGADHLVACPQCSGLDFWERLFMSYFGLMFVFRVRPWEVERSGRPAYFGFGAFNLVRKAAYRQCGGHGAFPMEVADDTKLGKIMKQNGFQTRLVDATDYISLRWVVGFRGIMDGFVKNAFASFDFCLVRTIVVLCGIAVSVGYPIFALLPPVGAARWLALGTLLAMVGGAHTMRRLTQSDARYGLAYPLAGLIVMGIILRSTWVTLRQQGIVWRGTFYPLDDLRRGIV